MWSRHSDIFVIIICLLLRRYEVVSLLILFLFVKTVKVVAFSGIRGLMLLLGSNKTADTFSRSLFRRFSFCYTMLVAGR